jgi:methylphosphotriester-DNA--protein-cysteine methyltransferase
VRAYEVVETSREAERTLVPETGLILAFRFAGRSWRLEAGAARETPAAAVTGLHRTARRMRTAAGGGVVLAKLREGRAAPFLEGPLHTLFGETRPLAERAPAAAVERALGEVRAASTDAERVDALERFLLRGAAARDLQPDDVVEAAVRAILTRPGAVRVRALAEELGLSVDALEKRFRRRVGASPKQLASIVRLRRALRAKDRAASLGELALEAGFYDQAHFGRQLAAQLGAAPGAFLSSVEYCME